MFTDIFLALQDRKNPRGHPILAAILYGFCPAAARWWLAGADPVPPFDPLWQALEDLSNGGTLKDALCRYGFGDLVEDAKQYVRQVDTWRDRNPGISAPEILPIFTAGRIDMSRRIGLRPAIENLGGRWENFFAYIRSWAFIHRDWEASMRFSTFSEFTPKLLGFTLSGIRRPVYIPAWSWTSRHNNVARIVIGMIVPNMEKDMLRLSLALRANPEGDQPWPSPPEMWVLERESGKAQHFDAGLDDAALADAVGQLAQAAQRGPYPPLVALGGSAKCHHCGFHPQCYTNNGELSRLALKFNAHSQYE